MAMTYTVIGPVVKRVTRNINKPPKDPKPQRGGASAFENAIEALSPLAWYRFREPNFTTRVKDSTANGYHLTKQLAAATRSAVKTRTTHPGGAYFPAVTYDNWATQGTFYKGVSGLLNGSAECTMLVSVRIIAPASSAQQKLFGIGTENVAPTGLNDLMMIAHPTGVGDGLIQARKRHGGGDTFIQTLETIRTEDGVNRLFIVRFNDNSLHRLTSSKPGHELLIEETGVTSVALDTLSKALILNARTETSSGSNTTTGMVIDQIALWASDIGAAAETDLHSKWSDEVAGAGYYPSMMQFDGSTGRYSLTTTDINTVAGWTVTGKIIWDGGLITSAGGYNRSLLIVFGSSGRLKIQVAIVNDQTADNTAGRLYFFCQNAAGTTLLNIFSDSIVSDGGEYTFFANYDPVAGAAQIIINGVADYNTSAVGHTLTTGTIETGSGVISVGARATPDRYFNGRLGAFGLRGAVLTNWSDFMDGSQPKAIDEKNWTEWGAQPLFWSHTGQMDNNKGSAGDMTKNGTITMTTGGSP